MTDCNSKRRESTAYPNPFRTKSYDRVSFVLIRIFGVYDSPSSGSLSIQFHRWPGAFGISVALVDGTSAYGLISRCSRGAFLRSRRGRHLAWIEYLLPFQLSVIHPQHDVLRELLSHDL